MGSMLTHGLITRTRASLLPSRQKSKSQVQQLQ